LQTWFLSFHASWVVLQHLQILKRASCASVVILQSSSQSRHASFSLASVTTSSNSNVHIKHTSVARDSERLQDSVPVLRLVEVLNKWLSIYHDSPCAGSHVYNGLRGLALAESPGTTRGIKLWFTLFLGQSSSEIEEVDTVVLGEVVW